MNTHRFSAFAIATALSFLAANLSFGEPVTLKGHVPEVAATLKSRGRIDPNKPIELSLVLRLRDQAKLEAQLKAIYDPRSPQFRHFLSPKEFSALYGPSEKDLEATLKFARDHNFTVVRTPANRALVHVRARAVDVEKAFGVELSNYADPETGKPVYALNHEPEVDAALPFHAIAGLNNFSPRQGHKRFPQVVHPSHS
jgi:subtilase family serine protease